MSREKQIDEMAKDICVAEQKTNYSCTEKCKKQGICAYCKVIAETLYNAGYRKQSEGEWTRSDEFDEQYGFLYKCSCCGVLAWIGKYCSNCGAKMKGGAE